MALLLEQYTFAKQYVDSWLHRADRKTDNALKVGVLSTATINAAVIIHPVVTHPDVVLYAIASRDVSKAESYAARYNFHKSYGTYEGLLSDPEVDFVYISLPNALHYEWAWRALDMGKHVLLEKPFTDNAIEATSLVAKAKQSGKILMEAFHWQFHPAAHRFREILDSKKYGHIIKTDAGMTSTPAIPSEDIRWKYDLGGGSLMDMTYVLSFTRYALHAHTPEEVLDAKVTPLSKDPRIDSSMNATLLFNTNDEQQVESTIYTDMARSYVFKIIPRIWEFPSIRVETEKAEIYFYNAMMPHIYHYISITEKDTKKTTYESIYKGGPLWRGRGENYWSTYRYQLEAFVDKVRGRDPVWWIDYEESIEQMKSIDEVYKASGLPLRPTSQALT